MDFIDSHAHLKNMTWQNLEEMYLAGIRGIVSPIQFDAAKPVASVAIIELWDWLFETQFQRAKENLINPYAMIGISMVGTPKENPEMLYKKLPDYLKMQETVAIGEIGFEPNSGTSQDLNFQEELINKQLEIAKKINMPVVFHVPNPPDYKKKFTDRTLAICKKHRMNMDNILIDHCSEINIKAVLDAGAYAAISVQPFRNMTPKLAAEIIGKFGFNRILVDSDFGSDPSDHLAVPKTAFSLKKLGYNDKNIQKVCYFNAKNFYHI